VRLHPPGAPALPSRLRLRPLRSGRLPALALGLVASVSRADGGQTPPAVGDRVRIRQSGAVQDRIVVEVHPDGGVHAATITGGRWTPHVGCYPLEEVEQLPPLPPCGDPEHRHAGPCRPWGRRG